MGRDQAEHGSAGGLAVADPVGWLLSDGSQHQYRLVRADYRPHVHPLRWTAAGARPGQMVAQPGYRTTPHKIAPEIDKAPRAQQKSSDHTTIALELPQP